MTNLAHSEIIPKTKPEPSRAWTLNPIEVTEQIDLSFSEVSLILELY